MAEASGVRERAGWERGGARAQALSLRGRVLIGVVLGCALFWGGVGVLIFRSLGGE